MWDPLIAAIRKELELDLTAAMSCHPPLNTSCLLLLCRNFRWTGLSVPESLRALRTSTYSDMNINTLLIFAYMQEFTAQMISFMWDPLVAAIRKEPEPDLTASMLDSLAEIVDLAEPGQLSAAQVQSAFQALQTILTQAEARRSQRSKVSSQF